MNTLTNDEIQARELAKLHMIPTGKCDANCLFHNNRTSCQHGAEGNTWRDIFGEARCTGCNGLR